MRYESNPITKLINESGFSVKQFAIYYRCPMSSLRNAMYGNSDSVPKKVKAALRRAGYNTDNIDREYSDWLVNEIIKEVEDVEDGNN